MSWYYTQKSQMREFQDFCSQRLQGLVCPSWLMAVHGCTSCTGDVCTGSYNPGCKHMCFSVPSAVGRSGQRIHICWLAEAFPDRHIMLAGFDFYRQAPHLWQ